MRNFKIKIIAILVSLTTAIGLSNTCTQAQGYSLRHAVIIPFKINASVIGSQDSISRRLDKSANYELVKMTKFQIISLITQIISSITPILSVIVLGIITYLFAIKGKKFDLLYASKITAFKEIAAALTEYKSFCLGRVAYYQGNEFSPYYNDQFGALDHRTKIATVSDLNSIFLSKGNRLAIEDLLNAMNILCNIELNLSINKNDTKDYSTIYYQAAQTAEKLIDTLYKDLNLK